jgi:hypothetical protein
MDDATALDFLSGLSREHKLQFLAYLCHGVTIAGRETYDMADGVATPDRLRSLNEVLHSLTGVIAACLADKSHEFPDSFIVTMFFGRRADKCVERMLSNCFVRQIGYSRQE